MRVQPVVVDVAPDVPADTATSLRDAVSRETGVPAVAPWESGASGARGTLRVVVDSERHLVLSFRNAAGHEVWRLISEAGDASAALATVAFLAGSLSNPSNSAPPPAQPAQPGETVLDPQTIPNPMPVAAPTRPDQGTPFLPPPGEGRQWALVPVRVPRALTSPEERAFNRRARHDPALGFYAYGGGGASGFGGTAMGVTGVNLAVTPSLLVDVSFGTAKPERGYPYSYEPHTVENRTWVGAMLAVRLPFHVFRFEAGAGPVVLWGDTFATHTDDTSFQSINDLGAPASFVRFGLQGRVSVYAAIHRYIDFFVTGYGAYSDGVYGSAAGQSFDSRWFLAAGAGLQIRVPTGPRRHYVPGT